jgi:hypothetical protein
MNIRWEKTPEEGNLGYVGKVIFFVVESPIYRGYRTEYYLTARMQKDDEFLYTTLRAAKKGAERKLKQWLKDAELMICYKSCYKRIR